MEAVYSLEEADRLLNDCVDHGRWSLSIKVDCWH